MKLRCKHCGEVFTADPEDVKLLEEGYIDSITEVCDDCCIAVNQRVEYIDDYSDADSGL